MNKTTTWVMIVAAFIVGGLVGFLFERQRATDKMESYKLEAQKMVDEVRMMTQKAMASPTPTAQGPVMMAKDEKLGMIAKAENGMTLYTYDKDTKNTSNCTGTCATNWPPYTAASEPTAMAEHVGTTKRADGTLQYTWDGKPLYFYIKDKEKADAYGDGVGEVWHVVK